MTVRPIHLIDGGYEVNEVFFDNVRVPADQLVGEENKGWTYAKFLLGNERTSNAAIGMIKNRLARMKRLAGPLLDDPLFRARLTRLEVRGDRRWRCRCCGCSPARRRCRRARPTRRRRC